MWNEEKGRGVGLRQKAERKGGRRERRGRKNVEMVE